MAARGVASSDFDKLNEFAEYHEKSPATVGDLLISVTSLAGGDGRTIEGAVARVSMVLSLNTNKGKRSFDYLFRCAITPNAR